MSPQHHRSSSCWMLFDLVDVLSLDTNDTLSSRNNTMGINLACILALSRHIIPSFSTINQFVNHTKLISISLAHHTTSIPPYSLPSSTSWTFFEGRGVCWQSSVCRQLHPVQDLHWPWNVCPSFVPIDLLLFEISKFQFDSL